MADYLPKFKPGEALTRLIAGTTTGGRIVTAGGVQASSGSGDWLGVASRDAVTGDRITVFCDGVQRVVATGAIAQGARVKCAANGTVSTFTAGTDASDLEVGIALEAGTDTNLLDVKFKR